MFHSSKIELSRSAFQKNIKFIKKLIGDKTKYSSVIKGNAYGHGIEQFVPLAEECGIDHFSVFSAYEGHSALNSRTKNSHICIMGAIDNDELAWAIENDVSFYVFDTDRLKAAITAARKIKIPARIHIELETGLNRTGLQGEELIEAASLVKQNIDFLQVDGVCTHFAGAESVSNYLRISNQIEEFNRQCKWLEKQGINLGLKHTACSAAALTYPETRFDMVRIGIAQYGFWPSHEIRMQYIVAHTNGAGKRFCDPLKRVMSWKTKIMSLKEINPGEFIGYGTSYLTSHKQKIASIPVGYHYGFARSLSNVGYVLVRGKRAPVVGMVNMHVVLIDVTRIKDIRKGDEVVIIGKQGKSEITVGSFSDLSRFQNYEVLARLPGFIPRIIVD